MLTEGEAPNWGLRRVHARALESDRCDDYLNFTVRRVNFTVRPSRAAAGSLPKAAATFPESYPAYRKTTRLSALGHPHTLAYKNSTGAARIPRINDRLSTSPPSLRPESPPPSLLGPLSTSRRPTRASRTVPFSITRVHTAFPRSNTASLSLRTSFKQFKRTPRPSLFYSPSCLSHTSPLASPLHPMRRTSLP